MSSLLLREGSLGEETHLAVEVRPRARRVSLELSSEGLPIAVGAPSAELHVRTDPQTMPYN